MTVDSCFRRRSILALWSLAFLLVATGCASSGEEAGEAAPSPTSVEQQELPLHEQGGTLITAQSAGAVLGQPYPFRLFTHCGLDEATMDFDGSFWALVNPNAIPPGLHRDLQEGTLTLIDVNHASFVFAQGELLFRREGPTKRVRGCD
jgi:hypothetical protein